MDPMKPLVTFSAEDRCDRCGARAYSKAINAGGTELLFCAHHLEEHGPKLFQDGWEIVSDTEGLDKIGASIPVYS